MKTNPFFLLFLTTILSFGQETPSKNQHASLSITPEVLFGITGEANTGFPDRKVQKQLYVSLGFNHTYNTKEWAQRLNKPRTGISIGVTDFGNTKQLGYAVSVLPFMEFPVTKNLPLSIYVGTGTSYFNKIYNASENRNNKAVSSHFTWAFRLFSYYQIAATNTINWRAGLGYAHHSNGHVKLPNQGFNSFLLSVSADIKAKKQVVNNHVEQVNLSKSRYTYLAFRGGYGANALSISFNHAKDVYTFSGEYGIVYNNTYKIGVGFYYRFYENYYNYIRNNESLVQSGREFEDYKNNATWNASNIGISLNGELLMNHIGIDLQIGFNVFKPGYKIDWRINEGWEYIPREIPENSKIVLGELDTYFKIKHIISSRLGFKYYVIGTDKQPKSNVYAGVFINGNLGQADFSEIALGYVYKFP